MPHTSNMLRRFFRGAGSVICLYPTAGRLSAAGPKLLVLPRRRVGGPVVRGRAIEIIQMTDGAIATDPEVRARSHGQPEMPGRYLAVTNAKFRGRETVRVGQ